MTVVKISFLSLAGVTLLVLLKKHSPSFTVTAEMSLILAVFLSFSSQFGELYETVHLLFFETGVSTSFLKIMIKAFGILVIGGITADICKDNGENGVADAVDTVVKLLAFLCAVPLFSSVVKIALEFIGRQ